MDKLHIRTVKALSKQIHIHQHLNQSCLEFIYRQSTFIIRSLRTYSHGMNPMHPILFRNMFCMLNVNRINNAFLVRRITQYGITKSFNTGLHIQLLAHLFQREISVSPSLCQTKHHALVYAVSLYRHIVIQRQPSVRNELLCRPRLQ